MLKSLARGVKHVIYALVVIVAGACVLEVCARGHRLYQSLNDPAVSSSLNSIPCPVCYESLPPLATLPSRHGDSGEILSISTNSLGLRGPEVAMPKADGLFRVICLGDERTLAADVGWSETFCVRLAESLGERRQVEVINAGVPGYCPLLSLVQLRQRLLGLQPDLVILNFDESDIADDQRCRPYARFDAEGLPQAVVHPAGGCDAESIWKRIEQEFLLVEMTRRHAGRLFAEEVLRSPPEQDVEPDEGGTSAPLGGGERLAVHIRQTFEPIAQLRDITERVGARFLLSVIPHPGRMTALRQRQVASGGADDVPGWLTEFARDHQIPMIDPAADLHRSASVDDLFFVGTERLSPRGHRLYTQSLAKAVSLLVRENSPLELRPLPLSRQPAEAQPPRTAAATNQPPPLRSLRRRPRDDKNPPAGETFGERDSSATQPSPSVRPRLPR